MTLQPGHKLSRYRLIEKIGQGGMGVVYRARDEHLERDVAIKVLAPGTLADDQLRKRFRGEALALSKIDHPNIAVIHDFDTHDGTEFLVMQFVPGESLAEKLVGGPLDGQEVLEFGLQICAGLEAAHQRDVIHRDLKPGNLRITPEGQLKILDFGLAKLVEPVEEDAPTLTETQGFVGTLPYMAPEQLRRERVDARTDVYAAGVVLYEMATGSRPFQEKSSAQLIDSILNREPPAPKVGRSVVSAGLERVILKALAKKPQDRYQSARELAEDLSRVQAQERPVARPAARRRRRSIALAALITLPLLLIGAWLGARRWLDTGGSATGTIDSLAVLPIMNLSGAADQDYFADWMTESLIGEFSQISALRVISHTSVKRYKVDPPPIAEIAKQLDLDAILEGSVVRTEDTVILSVRLIEAATEQQLWADKVQRPISDVLEMQGEVASAVAAEVLLKISPEELNRLRRARKVDPAAYDAYLQALELGTSLSVESKWRAREFLESAIQLDPNFAPAYSLLARVHMWLHFSAQLPADEAFGEATRLAERALEIDNTDTDARTVLAAVAEYAWNWEEAERRYAEALRLSPGSSRLHDQYSQFLSKLCRHDEAIEQARRAVNSDPLSSFALARLGMSFAFASRLDEAIETLEQVVRQSPDAVFAYHWLGAVYSLKRLNDDAVRTIDQALSLSPQDPRVRATRGFVLARAGRRGEAREILSELSSLGAERPVPTVSMAALALALGDKDGAMGWLERGYAAKDGDMTSIDVRADLDFAELREDPRFQELLTRMNFPRE